MNFRHIFEAVARKGVVRGYHSSKLFPQHMVEKIKDLNVGYLAQVKALNGVGRELMEKKTLFPDDWDGYKIIENFFQIFKKINEIKFLDNGKWIESTFNKQIFQAFLSNEGVIRTFFPLGDK